MTTIIRYSVQTHPRYKHLYQSFRWWLRSVLNSKNKHSITNLTGVKYVESGDSNSRVDIIARLVPQSEINKVCGFEQLSCSLIGGDTDEIMFSYENWMGGSHYEGSVQAYRKYLINHEFLHCRPFHLDHPADKEMTELCSTPRVKLPIMYQQSKGLVGKCVHNSWPLPVELELKK
jgi:hypothetical protein